MHAQLQPSVARLPRFAWDGQLWAAPGRSRRESTRLRVDRWDRRHDGQLSASALREKLEPLGYQTLMRTHLPGSGVAGRISEYDRIDAVLSGLLKITVDGETTVLAAGDTVRVARGSMRRLEVVGSIAVVAVEAERR